MASSARNRDEIENLAETIRLAAAQVSAPVRPEVVAKHLGIEVKTEAFTDDLSGVLVRKGSKTLIATNSSHSPKRRSFTMAHEIGHFVLKHHGDLFVDKVTINRRDNSSSLATNFQEIEANQFAASLLMPKSLLFKEINSILDDLRDRDELIELLARVFDVSKKAMEFRLINLALIGSMDD